MDALSLKDLPVGGAAPDFELRDLAGTLHRLADARGSVVVLNFWSAECPWSERTDGLLASGMGSWGPQVVVWWLASNANETPEQMRTVAEARGLRPVLLDSDHAVADRYGAATTPHLFVVDAAGVLRYRGAPDDITWRQTEATEDYIDAAVAAALGGRSPDPASTPAYGCSLVRFSLATG
jgi:peroxiredoxin